VALEVGNKASQCEIDLALLVHGNKTSKVVTMGFHYLILRFFRSTTAEELII
jgi:hypothetical protein